MPKKTVAYTYEVWMLTDTEFSQSYSVDERAARELSSYLRNSLEYFRERKVDAAVLALQFDAGSGEFVEWHVIFNTKDGRISKTLKTMLTKRIRRYEKGFSERELRMGTKPSRIWN